MANFLCKNEEYTNVIIHTYGNMEKSNTNVCQIVGGKAMKLSNKTYDILKWMAQYLLPALGTLYFGLSGVWGLAYGEQVIGTITAVDTFLGVLLGLSSAQYKKDNKEVSSSDIKKIS